MMGSDGKDEKAKEKESPMRRSNHEGCAWTMSTSVYTCIRSIRIKV